MSSKVSKLERTQKPEGLNDKDLELYISLAGFLGAPYVIARGSRVNGLWEDDSDYDVTIPITDSLYVKRLVSEHATQNGVKWDYHFGNGSLVDDWNKKAGRIVSMIIRSTP